MVAGNAEACRVWVVMDDWLDLVDDKRRVEVVMDLVWIGDRLPHYSVLVVEVVVLRGPRSGTLCGWHRRAPRWMGRARP